MGPRVLIAEDEALIRLDLAETLAEADFDVVGQASDGEAAVRLAAELSPDLVVMDVKMPRLDGISAAAKITAPGGPAVLMLTAYSQRDLVERAGDAGVMAYLVKPYRPEELVAAIDVALTRRDQLAVLEREVADLGDRLETRKLVDRAKSELQRRYGLAESDAFRWIQKTAMDKRTSMRAVAEVVLTEAGH